MSNKRETEINVYHTPQRVPRPDSKNKSNLRTAVPGVYQTRDKTHSHSQYAVHHDKKRAYQFSHPLHLQSEKRVSKNQWELRQRVDEYETQIGLLKEYLKGCSCNCIQKDSISRIFGFGEERSRLDNQEQRVIKELGWKVKSLIKENNSLKNQSVHYSQFNMEQIIQQNHKLQLLLQKYKRQDSYAHEKIISQNQLLKDELYRLRIQYEEKIKLLEIQYGSHDEKINVELRQWKTKYEQAEKQWRNELETKSTQKDAYYSAEIAQLEENYQRKLRDTVIDWERKLKNQEDYYLRIKEEWETTNKDYYLRLQSEELNKLKQYYVGIIEDIQLQQKNKFQKLINQVIQVDRKIQQTSESLSHLLFQRENRIQSTIRKSQNLAQHSPKPKGEPIQEKVPEQPERVTYSMIHRPITRSVQYIEAPQIGIYTQKISYLERQLNEIRGKLAMSEHLVTQKTERIICLQNEIRNLTNAQRHMRDSQRTVVKQIVKEVKVPPTDYTEEVKNIRQSIISCNLSNFDVFQTEFNEILEQRNQMNQKLMSLKKEAKESSKSLVLEKHLKVERQKNRQLEQNIKRYEKQIEALKMQVIELQNELENIQIHQVSESEMLARYGSVENLPDGKAGLEWQKVVKHCLVSSISRLQSLQNRMKEDLTTNRQ